MTGSMLAAIVCDSARLPWNDARRTNALRRGSTASTRSSSADGTTQSPTATSAPTLRIRSGSASRLRRTVLQPLSSRVTRPGTSLSPSACQDASNSSLHPSRMSHRSSMMLRVASRSRQQPTTIGSSTDMEGFHLLARLARFSFRKRRIMVFAIWLPLLIGISAIGGAIGSNYHTDFNLPNSDSKVVQDALESGGNKEDAGWTAQIVFTSPNGTDDSAVKAAMEPFFAEVDKLDGVKGVSPYSPEGADFNSKSKPISFAQLSVNQRRPDATID